MKTYTAKKQDIEKKWYLIDAKDKVLGHVDMGDNVIIINADKVRLTGEKSLKKVYYRHSGYPGGLKETTFLEIMKKDPTFALRNAIKGMLPHTRLGRKQLLNVKIYAGENHPHQAQKPENFVM
jgi:large subunit ribosomal protein L13